VLDVAERAAVHKYVNEEYFGLPAPGMGTIILIR